jgi:hypothetical protein
VLFNCVFRNVTVSDWYHVAPEITAISESRIVKGKQESGRGLKSDTTASFACIRRRQPRETPVKMFGFRAQYISVGMITTHRLNGRVSLPGIDNMCSLLLSVQTDSQPRMKLVQGLLSRGKSSWGVKLTNHLQLVPRWSYNSTPPTHFLGSVLN